MAFLYLLEIANFIVLYPFLCIFLDKAVLQPSLFDMQNSMTVFAHRQVQSRARISASRFSGLSDGA